MKLRHAIAIAAIIFSLTTTVKAADAPAVPDFSKSIPGTTLTKVEEDKGVKTFHLATKLSSKEFSKKLRAALGAGWQSRTLTKDEMLEAAKKGRVKGAQVNLAVYVHPKLSGVSVRSMHFKPNDGAGAASVEIVVVRTQ